MDLSLARFQQIVSAIKVRRYLDAREENARTSWLGRVVSTFVAGGYMVSGDNPAVEAAGKIAIDDIEAILYGTHAEDEWEPGKPAVLKKEPTPGSFEKLMTAMSQTR